MHPSTTPSDETCGLSENTQESVFHLFDLTKIIFLITDPEHPTRSLRLRVIVEPYESSDFVPQS